MLNGFFLVCVYLLPLEQRGTHTFCAHVEKKKRDRTTYISARLVFGTYTSFQFWRLMVPSDSASSSASILADKVRQAGWVRWLYLALNLSANGLNFVSPTTTTTTLLSLPCFAGDEDRR